ncbi:unnamed protein product [Caretta caretta]
MLLLGVCLLYRAGSSYGATEKCSAVFVYVYGPACWKCMQWKDYDCLHGRERTYQCRIDHEERGAGCQTILHISSPGQGVPGAERLEHHAQLTGGTDERIRLHGKTHRR